MKNILAIPLVCAGLSMSSVTLGTPIGPGFDLFQTIDGAQVDLGGCVIPLEGYPTLLAPLGLDNTDTIVERIQGSSPPPFDFSDGEVTVDIELVALSLKSKVPVDPSCVVGLDEKADLYVTVNALGLPNFPQPDTLLISDGEMMINHLFPKGGEFKSEMEVNADLIFVKPDKDVNNSDNWLGNQPAEKVSLESSGCWTHRKPWWDKHNNEYPAGKFYIDPFACSFIHIPPDPKDHPVEPTGLLVTLDYFTATATRNGSVILKWKTGTEKNNARFAIWRGEPVDGTCSTDPNNYPSASVKRVGSLVDSKGTEVSGATYKKKDRNVVSGKTYCYVLQDIEYGGGDRTYHMDNIAFATPR